jgi:BirA family biotin operon repressor/biotin-[acetyl-CoA-carboxylase] ligase
LICSVLLRPAAYGVPVARWPTLSLTVGVSLALSLRRLLPAQDFRVKWPNDVYCNRRKLAGILLEPCADGARIVAGVGLNLANSLVGAPREVVDRAVSLCDLDDGAPPTRLTLLTCFLNQFTMDLERLASGDRSLAADWRELCLLGGGHVAVLDLGGTVAGTCLGIDDDGALLVQTVGGVKRQFSGTVVEFDG